MQSRVSSFLVVAILTVAALPAVAQNLPPDIVQLTNGGMVRGTILENIPGDHVTIQLSTGETRRFGPSEVRSAGPAAPAAGQAAPPPVMAPPTQPSQPMQVPPATQPPPAYLQQAPMLNPELVTLRVTSATQAVTLHRLTGTANVAVWTGRGMGYGVIDSFEPMCTAPCAVQVPRGTYTLGLSQGEGRPRRSGHSMFTIVQNTDLTLEYESREGLRVGGWVIFGAASVGYLIAALAPIGGDADAYLTILAVASVAYLVLMIPSFIMIFMNDHADVREMGPASAPPSGQF